MGELLWGEVGEDVAGKILKIPFLEVLHEHIIKLFSPPEPAVKCL